MEEVSAHCATDDFGVPQVNGARQGDRGGGAQAGGGSNQGPDVSWVLNAVEHEETSRVDGSKVFQRTLGCLGNDENSLWAFGFRGAFEFRGRDVGDLDRPAGERVAHLRSARTR